MIDFEHVSKQYKKGEKPALDDINLHIDDGEFVFLLGHSGAGKSTLLKLLLREERASSGRVIVDGKAEELDLPLNGMDATGEIALAGEEALV